MKQYNALTQWVSLRLVNHKLKPDKKTPPILFSVYAVNSEAHGGSTFLIRHNQQTLGILKHSRNSWYDNLHKPKVKGLLDIIESSNFTLVNQKSTLGEGIKIEGTTYEFQPFVKGKTAYLPMKSPIRSFLSRKYYSQALLFCNELTKARLPEGFEKTDSIPPLNIMDFDLLNNSSLTPSDYSLVHNDLSPSNILFRKNDYSVIDWEYAEIGPSIYNFFDIIFNFGCFLSTSWYKSLSVDSFTRSMTVISSNNHFSKSISIALINSGYSKIEPKQAESLLDRYLKNKTTLQKRHYGKSYHLDLFWSNIYKDRKKILSLFRKYWSKKIQPS